MTNKNLSQKICEVCGIKPEIIEDYDSNEYEIYPDFENNNNNFVKLLELKILTGCTLWGFYRGKRQQGYNRPSVMSNEYNSK